VPLQTLRERASRAGAAAGVLKVRIVTGGVRAMHRLPEYAGALFQVASQCNLLEMTCPGVSPEQGVTRYRDDPTQGPACAIAAGAATIFRNYFVPVDGETGQTARRQLDALADRGDALASRTGEAVETLWTMQNGYALCPAQGLRTITRQLESSSPGELDVLRGLLRIGVHRAVEVTDGPDVLRPIVSQAFCSALPVACCRLAPEPWRSFATLVLEAAYEATLWAAVDNRQRGGSSIVLLTRLGGGAFGNEDGWIDVAMHRALQLAIGCDLDVRIVSYGRPSPALQALAAALDAPTAPSSDS